MDDASTHVIFYQGYWHLVLRDNLVPSDSPAYWQSTATGETVCIVGHEERILELKEIPYV